MIRIIVLSVLAVFHFAMYFLAMSHLSNILEDSGYGILTKTLVICTSVIIGLMLPVFFLALGRTSERGEALAVCRSDRGKGWSKSFYNCKGGHVNSKMPERILLWGRLFAAIGLCLISFVLVLTLFIAGFCELIKIVVPALPKEFAHTLLWLILIFGSIVLLIIMHMIKRPSVAIMNKVFFAVVSPSQLGRLFDHENCSDNKVNK
jgi:hypothetical protein